MNPTTHELKTDPIPFALTMDGKKPFEVRYNDRDFKIGDKLIQTKNDYKRGIMNGDIGYVLDISTKDYLVEFDGDRKVLLPRVENNLDLAYAITVHKFQGIEAPIVIIPINKKFHSDIVNNNWLYTAISRASRICILVGQIGHTQKIIKNKLKKRHTNLEGFLKN